MSMIAIDTNIVVRFLVRDDETQWTRADFLIRNAAIFVPATVVLETAWVLQNIYGYRRLDLNTALEQFLGLPTVVVETPERFAATFDWVRGGLDFADAMHLAASENCERFSTFDRPFAKAAKGSAPPVSEA